MKIKNINQVKLAVCFKTTKQVAYFHFYHSFQFFVFKKLVSPVILSSLHMCLECSQILLIKLQTVNNQPLSFGTNSTTRMVITGANVGIGTLSPYSLLDVQLASAAIRYLTLSTNDGQGSYNGFGLNFRVADGTHDIAQIRGAYENSNGGGYGGLFFATRFAGTLSNRLHINDDGRVGIGVSYGTTLLSVGGAGSTSAASGITFGGDAEANIYRSEADHIKTDGSFVVTNTLIVGGAQNGVRILKNGSDSISSNLYIANAANTRVFNFQQNAAGTNLALWGYNSSNTFQNLVY